MTTTLWILCRKLCCRTRWSFMFWDGHRLCTLISANNVWSYRCRPTSPCTWAVWISCTGRRRSTSNWPTSCRFSPCRWPSRGSPAILTGRARSRRCWRPSKTNRTTRSTWPGGRAVRCTSTFSPCSWTAGRRPATCRLPLSEAEAVAGAAAAVTSTSTVKKAATAVRRPNRTIRRRPGTSNTTGRAATGAVRARSAASRCGRRTTNRTSKTWLRLTPDGGCDVRLAIVRHTKRELHRRPPGNVNYSNVRYRFRSVEIVCTPWSLSRLITDITSSYVFIRPPRLPRPTGEFRVLVAPTTWLIFRFKTVTVLSGKVKITLKIQTSTMTLLGTEVRRQTGFVLTAGH